MTKVKFKTGQIFAIPLKVDGFGCILVSHRHKRSLLCIGYVFDIYIDSLSNIDSQNDKLFIRSNVLQTIRFSALNIEQGIWPCIGEISLLDKEQWPMPFFWGRVGVNKAKLIQYADDDLYKVATEKIVDYPVSGYGLEELQGAEYVELTLTKHFFPDFVST